MKVSLSKTYYVHHQGLLSVLENLSFLQTWMREAPAWVQSRRREIPGNKEGIGGNKEQMWSWATCPRWGSEEGKQTTWLLLQIFSCPLCSFAAKSAMGGYVLPLYKEHLFLFLKFPKEDRYYFFLS